MKQSEKNLTIEEVENLCQLYLDCKLTVFEESELEYMFMYCDFQSPLINETKKVMAVSHSVKLKIATQRINKWTWVMRIAACASIILGTFAIYRYNTNINNCNDNCIVYVAGERVSFKEAHIIAEADVAKMQQFMQTVNEQKAAEEAKVKQFMNHINQSK